MLSKAFNNYGIANQAIALSAYWLRATLHATQNNNRGPP
jgi:hypothetical protein